MFSLGIDIGYSSIKFAVIDDENEIIYSKYKLHHGYVKNSLKELLKDSQDHFNLNQINYGAVTGSGSKLIIDEYIEPVNQVTALVEGSGYLNTNVKSIIEIGGQNAKYITDFNQSEKTRIKISMNSKCAAGTGSFLEEQVSRLNLNLEDYSLLAEKAGSIPRIAGRCSVFAKTDIIHHQQEGVSVNDILLGLAYAVVKNYKNAVIKRLPIVKPVMLAGGVANNNAVFTALKDVLKLTDEELIVPKNFDIVTSIGAALVARKEKKKIDFEKILETLSNEKRITNTLELHAKKLLPLEPFGRDNILTKHNLQYEFAVNEIQQYYLGIDVGSTSTNLVLINENSEIIKFQYLRTLGDPVKAVKKGFEEIQNQFQDKIKILGVGITGSGRYMIGSLIGADIIKDEITAQAAAAVHIDKEVDTIFEIGGQDSKFISIKNGVVKDFQMNKVCAAGTGSFIEEQSKKFDIPITSFADYALRSTNPADLGERCTVFIESSIATHLAEGKEIDDIAAGLCYSIVKNYLNRVVGKKQIGRKVFLQGGIAHNQGIINAFKVITGKEIIVPPFFSVTGAYGAAISTIQEMNTEQSNFKGFDFDQSTPKEINIERKETVNQEKFSNRIEKTFFEGYESKIDPDKKTVGIPRALFSFGMFPMFNVFFRELGFNVLLSDPTTEETIRLAQEHSLEETCYPVKLVNGHLAELIKKKVDFIFFPDLFTSKQPASKTRKNYGCVYMQLAFKLASQAMGLEEKGITLLAPKMAFNLGQDFMMKSFSVMGKELEREDQQIFSALKKVMMISGNLKNKLEEKGKTLVENITSDEKVFVIISKIYGVVDPVLNMGVPDKLTEMGYKVISFSDIMENGVFEDHPNMYWTFAQHMLGAARYVKDHPNFYAVFLTHHGCGPDSIVSHYFKEIMEDKPYLSIEVDEHSSSVGVVTRVEAFVNSLNKQEIEMTNPQKKQIQKINFNTDLKEIEKGTTLYFQNLYPYSYIFKEILLKQGFQVEVLPEPDNNSIQIGRKYTITNEYLSLTALLGDIFNEIKKDNKRDKAFLILQNEGSEIDGQYSRLLRTKLDEEEHSDIEIFSPFIEDLIHLNEKQFELCYLALIAGDIINMAPENCKQRFLKDVLNLIEVNNFELKTLKKLSFEILQQINDSEYKKRILAIGEPVILLTDFLNNQIFKKIKEKGHRVVYAPLSEYVWIQLSDYIFHSKIDEKEKTKEKLNSFKNSLNEISACFEDETPFEKDIENLLKLADKILGFYAGANGRYRVAKLLSDLQNYDGVITVSSIYENTGIALNIIQKEFENSNSKPVLNLSFDASKNENDEVKVNSFLHYL